MPGPYPNSDRYADLPEYDEPTLHECLVCRTTVLMSPREAFDADWDAPPWFPYTACPGEQHTMIDVLVALGICPRGSEGSIWPGYRTDQP